MEEAETFNANCEECEGEDVPEKCGVCFPYFDKARVKRMMAIREAADHPVDNEYPGFGLCECGAFPWPHDKELCGGLDGVELGLGDMFVASVAEQTLVKVRKEHDRLKVAHEEIKKLLSETSRTLAIC